MVVRASIAHAVARLTAPLRRRVLLMVRIGVLKIVRDSLATQELQVAVFDGEVLDKVKHLLPYGFTHHPLAGAEVLLVFPGGVTSNPIAVAVGGRAHRPKGLQPGEVAVYDDQGQSVTLARDGVVIETPFTVTVKAPGGMRCETPQLDVTGEIRDLCDGAGRTMSGMRAVYNSHVHAENDGGGPTDPPTEDM